MSCLASETQPYSRQRQALEWRFTQSIRRVALSRDEIASLPDNYALEVEAHTFAAQASSQHPELRFFPRTSFNRTVPGYPWGAQAEPSP
jgi:hypothetical protein